MNLTKYDYKRIEELLEEMIKEEKSIAEKQKSGANRAHHSLNADDIANTLRLIKERQTLKNGSTSTEDRGNKARN